MKNRIHNAESIPDDRDVVAKSNAARRPTPYFARRPSIVVRARPKVARLFSDEMSEEHVSSIERKRSRADSSATNVSSKSVEKRAKKHYEPRPGGKNSTKSSIECKRMIIHTQISDTECAVNSKNPRVSDDFTESSFVKNVQQAPSNKHVAIHPHTHPYTDTPTQSTHSLRLRQSLKRPANSSHQAQRERENVNTNLLTPPPAPTYLKLSTTTPRIVTPAFNDKLSITFNCADDRCKDTITTVAKDFSKGIDDNSSLRRVHPSGKQLYKYNYVLVSDANKHQAHISFEPVSPRANYARLELNPNEIGEEGLRQVRRILKALFGSNYKRHLADGNITRCDATVDIEKLKTNDILFFSDTTRTSSIWHSSFDRSGHETWTTETYALGSPSSGHYALAYDKSAQLWKVKGQDIGKLVTRIEVRITPRDHSGRSLRVRDMLEIANPFLAINVAYYPSPDKDDPWFEFFVCAVRQLGAEGALQKLDGKNKAKRVLYRQKLQEHEPDWWQPAGLWDEVLASLKATGLFPQSIFERARDEDV